MKKFQLILLLSLLLVSCKQNNNAKLDEPIDSNNTNNSFLSTAIINQDTINDELYETQFYSSYDSVCFNRNRIKNNRNLHKIASSIPTNHEIIYFKESDINTDELPDLIVVTERDKNQVGLSEELQNFSILFLLTGKKDGSFQLASFNTSIVLPSLNKYDRTFIGVDCFEGGFKVLHYHGTNNWWGYSVEFIFKKQLNDWYLSEYINANALSENPSYTCFTKITLTNPLIPFEYFNYNLIKDE